MYVTEIHRGTPFQSYLPAPMYPAFTASQVARIDAIEALLAGVDDREAYRLATVDAVLRHQDIPGIGLERRTRVEAAIAHAFGKGRLDSQRLKQVNAVLCGQSSPGLRQGPIWIAAAHPSLSTHVGSPVARLDSLVAQIAAIQARGRPVLLGTLVSMVRMLQVHPFRDANGRTARLLACAMAAAGIGNNPIIPRAIAALWRGGSLGINQMCVAVRDSNDWDPLLDSFAAISTRLLRATPSAAVEPPPDGHAPCPLSTHRVIQTS